MRVLGNSWSDEARAASLEVRRSKRQERGRQDMIERKRKEFFAANPGASEADWKAHDAKQLKEWQKRKDMERWLKANPGKTEADWKERDKERLKAWKQREDEEAALFDEQSHAPRRHGEPFVDGWFPRLDDGTLFPSVYIEETGEVHELPPEMREPELDWRSGEFYPSTAANDPHWGSFGPEAPYGYHDATGEPRKEPLYDRTGKPIVPRLPEHVYRKPAEREAAAREHRERQERALKEWGLWGKGRERGRLQTAD
jgi:hypothetical protein